MSYGRRRIEKGGTISSESKFVVFQVVYPVNCSTILPLFEQNPGMSITIHPGYGFCPFRNILYNKTDVY